MPKGSGKGPKAVAKPSKKTAAADNKKMAKSMKSGKKGK
jgi:hypothetical protein